MAKRGTAKPKKEANSTKCFKLAAFKLLAHKAYCDYMVAQKVFKNVEPEHFLEEWTSKLCPAMYKEEQKAFWIEFMYLYVNKAGQ